jgi:hypothetical protein
LPNPYYDFISPEKTEDVVMRLSLKPFVLGLLMMVLVVGLLQVWAQGPSAANDPAFSAFWIKFKAAVARSDKSAVADMTKLPFLLDSRDQDRAGFIK